MASRAPITIDIGDGKDRAINFTVSYAKKLKAKYGNLKKMLTEVESEDFLPQIIFDGLKDKDGFDGPDAIADAMDANYQLAVVVRVLAALTGNPVPDLDEATKNALTPVN